MRPSTLVVILCLLVIVGAGTWGATSRRDAPWVPRDDPSQVDRVEIPGIDWAALGAWARDHAAVKGSEGEWVGLEELLESLDTFSQAAAASGAEESVDVEDLRILSEKVRRWRNAREERLDLLWGAAFEASDEPAVWGRLQGALGPGIMAGAHEAGLEIRRKLAERMQEVQTGLTSARGEARATLEAERERLQDAIVMIDRIPAPTEAARERWETIRRLLQKKPEVESKAEGPAGD